MFTEFIQFTRYSCLSNTLRRIERTDGCIMTAGDSDNEVIVACPLHHAQPMISLYSTMYSHVTHTYIGSMSVYTRVVVRDCINQQIQK